MGVTDDRRERLGRLSKAELIDEVCRLEAISGGPDGNWSPEVPTAEAALRLSAFLDAIPAFVSVKDAAGRYLLINRYQAETLGMAAGDYIGKTTAETVSPEHFKRVSEFERRVVTAGETIADIEVRLARPNGEAIWLNVRKAPVLDPKGQPTGIISVGIDVTAERKAERALEENRSLLQQVIDAAPVVLTVKDRSGRYVYANCFASENFDLTPDDMVGKRVGEVLPAELASIVLENDDTVFRTGEATPFFEEALTYGGVEHKMMTSKTPVRDALGEVDYVVTVAIDITEMKTAKDKLAEVETRLSALVAQSPMAIYLKDLDGRFIMANQPIVEMFMPGGTEQDLIGKTAYDLASPDHADKATAMDRRVVETGLPQTEEFTESFEDGRVINTLAHKFPITDGADRTIAIGGFETEITEIAATRAALIDARDAAEAASRAKSQFLANMSHELRTPLNSIIGFSSLIADPDFGPEIDEQYRQYAEDISFSGTHLLEVINDILDVARIEAGTVALQEGIVDVATVAAQCIGLIGESAAQTGVEVINAVTDGLLRLTADDRQVRQILLNLLSNAVKFTPDGGRITVSATGAPGGHLDIVVSDTGVGITAADLPIVIQPFRQVGDIMTRQHEGSGLGLFLAKAMVEAHGGQLMIGSEIGVGTTVTVRFPASRLVAE